MPAGPVATVAVAIQITPPTAVTVAVAPPPAAGGVQESFIRMQIFAEGQTLMANEGPRRAAELRRPHKTDKHAKGDRDSKAQRASNAGQGSKAGQGPKADQGS